ncbi:SPOSA6832_04321 [Sporobolomyces salmonicolor]|uniref:RNA-dependent RNA polymerase n=1 Tax=Sporidiobolus salmonicolor TaxID=5005 RepID=A0A0D6EQW3_SPOSA|nr:SPOSA6832_04321 [Sporobolomyces salmonicolor]
MRQPDLSRLHRTTSHSSSGRRDELSCGIRSIAFGVFAGRDRFSAEWEREGRGVDKVFFEQRKDETKLLVLRMWDPPLAFGGGPLASSSIRITIEGASINRIQCTSGGTSLFFHLALPPLLEALPARFAIGPASLPRQVPFFDDDHARIAGYCNRVLRIKVRSRLEFDAFVYQAEEAGLPRIVASKITAEETSRFGNKTMASLQTWMSSLDFRIAFQLEKLLWNGLVDGVKLLGLKGKVEQAVQAKGEATAERILSLFADSLDRLAAIRPTPAADVVVLDDADQENRRPPKRRRQSSPIELSDSDDDIDIPSRLLPTSASASHHPSELEPSELLSLLIRALSESASLAQIYAAADPTCLARHVAITPTGLVLAGPVLEDSNSVIRQYRRPENFLRVAVRNEDGSLLRSRSNSIVETRFKALFRGFDLGGRSFLFVGWSSSALKSGSCFFVSPFDHKKSLVTSDFSSSRPSIALRPDQVLNIDDLLSESGSCFSDGAGLISPQLAADVVEALGIKLRPGQKAPTCFQFRMGGAKGMLQVDPSLGGKVVALRPSQVKFRSHLTSLEIAGIFDAGVAFLNRPLIKLLEDLGVPTDAFLRCQAGATRGIRKSRQTLRSALKLLDEWNLAPSSRFSSALAYLAQHSRTSAAAFSNPFVVRSLNATVVHALREIKWKARIPLPGCWNLVGVVDTSGCLAQDEIYARIQKADGTIECLKGTVAISRSPTNHPGDCRLVKTVGKLPKGVGERIRSLINCLRALPSMLGGGDLDGDVYLILTESSGLLPSPDSIAEPAAYDPAPTAKLDREATIQDGNSSSPNSTPTACFRSTASGSPSSIVRDWPQSLLLRPSNPTPAAADCVDSMKSGTFVSERSIPRIPPLLAARGYPDFLAAAHDRHCYRSPKALGQLFRAISLDDVRPPDLSSPCAVDPLRALSTALASLEVPGLPGNRLPPKPSRRLVEHYKAYLAPFCSELRKVVDLTARGRGTARSSSEEALLLGVVVGTAKLDRSDKLAFSRRKERTGELFRLVRSDIMRGVQRGDAAATTTTTTRARIEGAWAAWWAANEDDAQRRKEKGTGKGPSRTQDEDRFGLGTWAWLALSVLVELLERLEREQVESITID